MKWVCDLMMCILQTKTEKSFSYSISYSYSNLKVPLIFTCSTLLNTSNLSLFPLDLKLFIPTCSLANKKEQDQSRIISVEAWWPQFKPMSGQGHCVVVLDKTASILSQFASPPRCINWYHQNLMLRSKYITLQ